MLTEGLRESADAREKTDVRVPASVETMRKALDAKLANNRGGAYHPIRILRHLIAQGSATMSRGDLQMIFGLDINMSATVCNMNMQSTFSNFGLRLVRDSSTRQYVLTERVVAETPVQVAKPKLEAVADPVDEIVDIKVEEQVENVEDKVGAVFSEESAAQEAVAMRRLEERIQRFMIDYSPAVKDILSPDRWKSMLDARDKLLGIMMEKSHQIDRPSLLPLLEIPEVLQALADEIKRKTIVVKTPVQVAKPKLEVVTPPVEDANLQKVISGLRGELGRVMAESERKDSRISELEGLLGAENMRANKLEEELKRPRVEVPVVPRRPPIIEMEDKRSLTDFTISTLYFLSKRKSLELFTVKTAVRSALDKVRGEVSIHERQMLMEALDKVVSSGKLIHEGDKIKLNNLVVNIEGIRGGCSKDILKERVFAFLA